MLWLGVSVGDSEAEGVSVEVAEGEAERVAVCVELLV